MDSAGHYIITVDGPSGSGKSTVCRRVAARLGISYIDTGAMYRCVAWAALQKGIDLDDEQELGRLLENIDIGFQAAGTENLVLCNGNDVTRAIRTPEIDRLASAVSAIGIVRQALLPLQRAAARNNSAIIDGRDAGTVIFPKADLKIFLDADLEIRARRRLQEQKDQDGIDLESVMAAIRKRDLNDSSRALAPLRKPPGAVTIDTSRMSIDEVCEQIIGLVHSRILKKHD